MGLFSTRCPHCRSIETLEGEAPGMPLRRLSITALMRLIFGIVLYQQRRGSRLYTGFRRAVFGTGSCNPAGALFAVTAFFLFRWHPLAGETA